jgi:hypothetical protein
MILAGGERSMLSGAEGSDAAAEIAGKGRIAVPVPCYNEEAAPGKAAADCARPEPKAYLAPAKERRRS